MTGYFFKFPFKVYFATLSLSLVLSTGCLFAAETPLDFNRDVRPILSDNCYRCHGPDADNQKSEFRLDTREAAIADLGGYAGIVPGDPETSELHYRIWENVVDEERMPPPKSKLSLSKAEKKTLDRWIAAGAKYDIHWSFKAISNPEVPEVSSQNEMWSNNTIDHFIAARLENEGKAPSEPAPKETLIRRVSLDLTGLPPTPEEVDAFLTDSRSDAWERVVDRLLASPHYGEQMSLVWLDAARYADSGGYQNDILRSQWPWRDWVIDAYNDNMPFDQFTIEQLAGDLLPNPTLDQVLATAFNRNHRINNEGGIVPEEFLVEYVADRAETTSTVWMGLTVACARCHDHKYDPISQKDFYEIFAFFNTIQENGKDGNIAPEPNMMVYTTGTEEEHQLLKQAVRNTKRTIIQLPQSRSDFFEAWIDEQKRAKPSELAALASLPVADLHLPLDSENETYTANARDISRNGIFAGRGNEFPTLVPKTEYGKGFKFGRSNFLRINNPHEGGFNSQRPYSWLIQVVPPKSFSGSEGPILSTVEDATLMGYRLMLEATGLKSNFRISFQLMENAVKDIGIEVVSGPIITPAKPVRIGVTWDGSNEAKGVKLYVDGQPVETTILLNSIETAANTNNNLVLGARTRTDARDGIRDATLLNGIIDDVQVFERTLPHADIALLSAADPQLVLLASPSSATKAFIETAWIEVDDEGKRLTQLLRQQEAELNAFEKKEVASVSIMKEMEEPRPTYLLTRGAYDHPDKSETLQPATLDVLPPMSDSLPVNRLGLAQWLVDPAHPLTARVAVNRYWQRYFGVGLVKTSEDFGSQGELPSHPLLLDWLASEFIRSDWNIKAMQKFIVMSATYRQSSFVTSELIEWDPDNRLLARGPRYRLGGQVLRDQALAVSGLLAPQIGGPPVMPYQPEGLWDEVSAKGYKYIVGDGDDLYRRSLYTFWRRTVPPPSMMNFDSSAREICSVRTNRTNTPLQALNLMNDPQFVEAARALAERMLLQGGPSVADQIAYGHQIVLARQPEPKVLSILMDGFESYLEVYQSEPTKAEQLTSVGASQPHSDLDPPTLAAMTIISNLLLNLDEAVTKE